MYQRKPINSDTLSKAVLPVLNPTSKSFANLPNELLENVLKRLEVPHLITLRLVCPRWAVVIPKMHCLAQKQSLQLFDSRDSMRRHELDLNNGFSDFLEDGQLVKLKPAEMDDHLVVKSYLLDCVRCESLVKLFPAVRKLMIYDNFDFYYLANLLNNPTWQNQLTSLSLFGSFPLNDNVQPEFMSRLFKSINSLIALKRLDFLPARQSTSIKLPSMESLAPTLGRLQSFSFGAYPELDSYEEVYVSTIRHLSPQCTRLCFEYFLYDAMSLDLIHEFIDVNQDLARKVTFLRISTLDDIEALNLLAQNFPSLEVLHIGFDEVEFQIFICRVMGRAMHVEDPTEACRLAGLPLFEAQIRELTYAFHRGCESMDSYRPECFCRTLSFIFPHVHKLTINVHPTADVTGYYFANHLSQYMHFFKELREYQIMVDDGTTGRRVISQATIDRVNE